MNIFKKNKFIVIEYEGHEFGLSVLDIILTLDTISIMGFIPMFNIDNRRIEFQQILSGLHLPKGRCGKIIEIIPHHHCQDCDEHVLLKVALKNMVLTLPLSALLISAHIIDDLTNGSVFGYKFWQAIYNERQDIDFPQVVIGE
ncbi:hypothetical protein A6A19_00315 [Actinobacillus delphinicola]|uniref:hypothetical protein n=1 Tax=Actinobacillus delphinicola TaxID=51161 RepID=UPI0024433DA0|nr:hypothetical protein [Actinobacillus delphinicola]MDG6896489.1 hypothetical protein [Actinobacillus delphinicola]